MPAERAKGEIMKIQLSKEKGIDWRRYTLQLYTEKRTFTVGKVFLPVNYTSGGGFQFYSPRKSMEQLRERWDARRWGIAQIGIYLTDAEKDNAFESEAKIYCSQNQRDCETCSLVKYGRDCHNNAL